jgi:hypothetical protein
MILDDGQKEKISRNLIEKWSEPRTCSVCKKQQWTITDKIFEIHEFHGGSLMVGGSIVPVITVTCANCGNTLFFNAILLGVVQPEIKETKDE